MMKMDVKKIMITVLTVAFIGFAFDYSNVKKENNNLKDKIVKFEKYNNELNETINEFVWTIDDESGHIVSESKKNVIEENNKIFYNLSESTQKLLIQYVLKEGGKNVTENEAESILISIFEHCQDPYLMLSIITKESHFDAIAVSNKNAFGLTQVRWSVWKKKLKEDLGLKKESDLFDIENSIRAGEYVLRFYNEMENGNDYLALYRYAGKSKAYADDIFKIYEDLKIFLKDGNNILINDLKIK